MSENTCSLFFIWSFSGFGYAVTNLIESAELKGNAVDTFGEGIADVDAAHGLDESAHLPKIKKTYKYNNVLRQIQI